MENDDCSLRLFFKLVRVFKVFSESVAWETISPKINEWYSPIEKSKMADVLIFNLEWTAYV